MHRFLLLPLFYTGMISGILSPDAIDSALTRLVLVNAVYFKGLWKSRFQPENTKKRTFNGADGKAYQIPMLAQLSVFRCGMHNFLNLQKYRVPSPIQNSLQKLREN